MEKLRVDFSDIFLQLIYFETSFSKLYFNNHNHVFILNKNFKETMSITKTQRKYLKLTDNLNLKQFKIEASI